MVSAREARRWVIAITLLGAKLALACPMCAGRDDGVQGATAWLVGAMIAVPFVLGATVFLLVKRLRS